MHSILLAFWLLFTYVLVTFVIYFTPLHYYHYHLSEYLAIVLVHMQCDLFDSILF